MTILVGFVLISLVILVHELGHLLVAKILSVPVLSFSVGMGPKVAGVKLGGTFYCFRLIPLGGFVRAVDVDAEEEEKDGLSKADAFAFRVARRICPLEKEEEEALKELKKTPRPKVSKVSQLLIISGGVLANIMSMYPATMCLCLCVVLWGDPKPVILKVQKGSLAAEAGIRKRDVIEEVDGVKIRRAGQFEELAKSSRRSSVRLGIVRYGSGNGDEKTHEQITLKTSPRGSVWDEIATAGIIIRDKPKADISSFFYATNRMFNMTLTVLGTTLFNKGMPVQITGPVEMMSRTGESAGENYETFLAFFNALTFIVVLLNIIPLPATDGGKFITTCISIVIPGKEWSKLEAATHRFGFVVVMLLFIASIAKDIFNLFS